LGSAPSGLGPLFKLRGEKPAPLDVVVVSIDKESSDQLGILKSRNEDWGSPTKVWLANAKFLFEIGSVHKKVPLLFLLFEMKAGSLFPALPYILWFRERDRVFCFHIIIYEASSLTAIKDRQTPGSYEHVNGHGMGF
jgi:hypothetical protein